MNFQDRLGRLRVGIKNIFKEKGKKIIVEKNVELEKSEKTKKERITHSFSYKGHPNSRRKFPKKPLSKSIFGTFSPRLAFAGTTRIIVDNKIFSVRNKVKFAKRYQAGEIR